MAFRDSTVVIIETGRDIIRAGLGLHELLKTPAFQIQARVGLRESVANSARTSLAPSGSRAASQAPPSAGPADYLVGSQLDDALAAGQDITVFWPFKEGNITEWAQAEALWKYILFNLLRLRRAQNESPVLLSIHPGQSRTTYERICQIFFERLNVAGLGVVERPIAQIYAANSLSGVVVDIGTDHTDITPISEGIIVRSARISTPLGVSHCEAYLAHLLRTNQAVMASLSPPDAPLPEPVLQRTLLDLARVIWRSGEVKVPSTGETSVAEDDEGVIDIAATVVAGKAKDVIESGLKKKQNAKASAAELARAREIELLDLKVFEFAGKSITIGKERHRFYHPLFDPSLLNVLPTGAPDVWALQDSVGYAVNMTDIDQRQGIWGGLFVTGEVTQFVLGLGDALQSRLVNYMIHPETQTEVQAKTVRVLHRPEYYPEYRETGDGFAAFLGTSITAKIIFNDNATRNYVSKAEYAVKGPRAIIEFSPALL